MSDFAFFFFYLFQDIGGVCGMIYVKRQKQTSLSALISWEELLWLPLVQPPSSGHKARAPENLPPAPENYSLSPNVMTTLQMLSFNFFIAFITDSYCRCYLL